MNLISRKALKEALRETLMQAHNRVDESDFDLLFECIEEAPTAYDVDKVVERLEERTTFLKECTKYGNKDAEQQEKSYATMMMYEVAYLVDDLLEIVKGGGVDG